MKNKKSKVWFVIGICCLLGAIGLSAFNVWDSKRAGESVEKVAEVMIEELPKVRESETILSTAEEDLIDLAEYEIPDYILNPDMEMPKTKVDGQEYIGVVEIPALSLTLPVISECDDEKLKISPCRYMGSAYTNDLILSGHSYKTHFRYIRTLDIGNSVIFTDMDGNRFEYEVCGIEVIPETNVEQMEVGEWDLSLFTCTYDGNSRHTVRCKLVSDANRWAGFSAK